MNDLGDVAWFLAGVPLGLAILFACLYGHELLARARHKKAVARTAALLAALDHATERARR